MNTNVIHSYPKSSCACYECEQDVYKVREGEQTNLGVSGCDVSDYYDCFRTMPFKEIVEPNTESGIHSINPGVFSSDKRDPTFVEIDGKTAKYSACCGKTYLNSDPRLFNAAAGTWLQLDSTPINSSQKLSSLTHDKKLNCYGQNYRTYSDINAGQIKYHISKDRQGTYYEPLFSSKAVTTGYMYKDPMGNMKPMYTREFTEKSNQSLYTDNYANEGCLSFMKDSQGHREDLMAHQMTVRNQQRWEPRWANVH